MPDARQGFQQTPLAAGSLGARASQALAQDDAGRGIPTRRLGRSGEQVSILCVGGAHLGRAAQDDGEPQALKLAHAALENGVFFWDNAWAYHDGYAEEFVGKALQGRRDRVFLMGITYETPEMGLTASGVSCIIVV